jgi:hypothetical protein
VMLLTSSRPRPKSNSRSNFFETKSCRIFKIDARREAHDSLLRQFPDTIVSPAEGAARSVDRRPGPGAAHPTLTPVSAIASRRFKADRLLAATLNQDEGTFQMPRDCIIAICRSIISRLYS